MYSNHLVLLLVPGLITLLWLLVSMSSHGVIVIHIRFREKLVKAMVPMKKVVKAMAPFLVEKYVNTLFAYNFKEFIGAMLESPYQCLYSTWHGNHSSNMSVDRLNHFKDAFLDL